MLSYRAHATVSFVLCFIVCCLFTSIPPGQAQTVDDSLAGIRAEVYTALQTQAQVPVIINLRVDAHPIHSVQTAVLTTLHTAQINQPAAITLPVFDLTYRYQTLAALAGTISIEGVNALAGHPAIHSVQLDPAGRGALAFNRQLLGVNMVEDTFGLTGQGVRVAVLDSGIDVNHADFADGAIIAQQCFVTYLGQGDCTPGDTMTSPSAQDEHGHGTHVSGIITSENANNRGIAQDASLIAVRVLNQNNGFDRYSDIIAGLDWLIANDATLSTDVINMSLGTFVAFDGQCDDWYPVSTQAITQLHNLGVTMFAASLNDGLLDAIPAPACHSHVIAVGATTPGNAVSDFSNSGLMLDLLAPGEGVNATALGGGQQALTGTSMSAPMAAGIAALMLQANPNLTPDQIETMLKESGLPVTDPRNGLTRPRVDAFAALNRVYTALDFSLVGDLTQAPVRPAFTWNTLASIRSYHLYVDYAGAVWLDDTYPTTEICDDNVCIVPYPEDYPAYGLLNGTYRWWVGTVLDDGTTLWSGTSNSLPNAFTVNLAPASLPEQISVDAANGRPTITFTTDDNTLWVQLYIGPNAAFGDYLTWHERDGNGPAFTCDGLRCSIQPTFDAVNGTYAIWMQAWGPGGFSDSAAGGWVQGDGLTLNLPAPAAPSPPRIVEPAADNPVFVWASGAYATWYELVITPVDAAWTWSVGWFPASEIGCATPQATCTYTSSVLAAGVLPNGDYTLAVRAWGPGGLGDYVENTATYSGGS